jgi:DNA-binding Xre family transcriptional regulator
MITKAMSEGTKRLSYKDVESATGIKISTLSKIANDQEYNISRKNLESLCVYFNCEENINKLISIIPD